MTEQDAKLEVLASRLETAYQELRRAKIHDYDVRTKASLHSAYIAERQYLQACQELEAFQQECYLAECQ